jgi:hypothetical protein
MGEYYSLSKGEYKDFLLSLIVGKNKKSDVVSFRKLKNKPLGDIINLTDTWREEWEYLLGETPLTCYKLFRQMKDNSISSLFINKKERYSYNQWMDAKEIPTSGYAVRKGWHCLLKTEAPHLTKNDRVWKKVKVMNTQVFERPKSQGGIWILAQKMMICEN